MLRPVIVAALAILTGCSSSDSQSPGGSQPQLDAQPEGQAQDAPAPEAASETGAEAAAEAGPEASAEAAAEASSDDAQPDGGDASCKLLKPYSSSNATCNACAEKSCCELVNTCYADPACDDTYVNCILACALLDQDAGDAGLQLCMEDCATQAPQGKAEYEAAIGCADSQCAAECK